MTHRRKDHAEGTVAVYSDHADELFERHRQKVANVLKTLQEREASGIPIKQNDPTYPRREAEKIAVATLYDCVEMWEKLPPFEVIELVAHLLNRPADAHILEDLRSDKYYRAIEYLAEHPQASLREVGQAVGVSKDTIKKWRCEWYFSKMLRLAKASHEGRAS